MTPARPAKKRKASRSGGKTSLEHSIQNIDGANIVYLSPPANTEEETGEFAAFLTILMENLAPGIKPEVTFELLMECFLSQPMCESTAVTYGQLIRSTIHLDASKEVN